MEGKSVNTFLKEFIEQNIELIENNDFEMLYNQAWANENEFEIGELTKLLHEINIDPLQKMVSVPSYYLQYTKKDWSFEIFKIPSNIIELEDFSFGVSCRIKELILPTSIKSIGRIIFEDAAIDKVSYEGTIAEFKRILISYESQYEGFKINCSDGVYRIGEYQ